MSSLLKKAGLIFDANKVKPFLKMSITRLSLLVNKKANHIKIAKKEIARLLADGKEEKARIKVEQVIREDFTIEAYDILELHCELVAERMRLVESQKDVPPDMEQAICTIIWAADRAEVAELSTVKAQFAKKYGHEYVKAAELNEEGCVNPKVVEKLDCQPPSGFVVTEYLLAIAEEFGVDFTPAPTVRRKSSTSTEHATTADAGPKPAYEAPVHHQYHPPPPSDGRHGGGRGGGGSGNNGGGGISSPPPVTAWAIPTESIPHATATLSPEGSLRGGGGPAAAGGASAPSHYPPEDKGHYLDTSGGHRRPSGGFEAATKGWGTPGAAADGHQGGEGKHDGHGGGGYDSDVPPPPYSKTYDPNDIPSPPTSQPMPAFDIPAAPGYEDPPKETAPEGGDGGGEEPPASPGAGSDMDDLAARFRNLRK